MRAGNRRPAGVPCLCSRTVELQTISSPYDEIVHLLTLDEFAAPVSHADLEGRARGRLKNSMEQRRCPYHGWQKLGGHFRLQLFVAKQRAKQFGLEQSPSDPHGPCGQKLGWLLIYHQGAVPKW